MSDSSQPPVVETPPVSDSGEPKDPKPDTVSYETHRRLLDEKKKVAAKLSEFEAKEKAANDEKLRQQGEYQKLIEDREKQLAEANTKVSAYETQIDSARKLSAFQKAAGDIDSKWLNLVDINKIAFKPDTKEVDEFSVKTAVDNFKKQWPEAIRRNNSSLPSPDMPNGISSITESEWKKLKGSAEKSKYKPDQIKWGQ